MKTSPDGSRGSKGFKSPLPGAGLSRHRCSRGLQAPAGPARRPRQRFPAGPFPRSTARLCCSPGAGARSVPGRGAPLPRPPAALGGTRGLCGRTELPGRCTAPGSVGRGGRGASRCPRGLGLPGAEARWPRRYWRGRLCFCMALTPRVLLWKQPVTGLRPCSALSPALMVELT